MTPDKEQGLATMSTRTKVTIGLFVVVVLIIVWQLSGLFGNKNKTPPPVLPTVSTAKMATPMQAGAPGAIPPSPQEIRPREEQLPKMQEISKTEEQLLQLQQETQAKYIAALNELQMLRLARDIAETNQAIVAAKLATVTSQKRIVDTLAPPPPPVTPQTYAQGLVTPAPTGIVSPQPIQPQVTYTVISVSQLQYRWSAVLGYQGNLYEVHIGDVLPPDGSSVVSIDRTGVVLQQNSVRKKVSLVPII